MKDDITSAPARDEEIYAYAISDLLKGARHVAVGMASPIPATAALLAKERFAENKRVSILGNAKAAQWTNGGPELFDLAGRGGIDGFFLSGGQIDGQANINLVGVGDYPQTHVRWSGCFGSAYLYYIVPRVILFRWEHTRRTLVETVDFISAPGKSEEGVYRTGGPIALITNLCLFHFNKERGRFTLASIHPNHSMEEVLDNTAFEFDVPQNVTGNISQNIPQTTTPDSDILAKIRGPVAQRIGEIYPVFAREVFAPYIS